VSAHFVPTVTYQTKKSNVRRYNKHSGEFKILHWEMTLVVFLSCMWEVAS
jgi:hypothetical protein